MHILDTRLHDLGVYCQDHPTSLAWLFQDNNNEGVAQRRHFAQMLRNKPLGECLQQEVLLCIRV